MEDWASEVEQAGARPMVAQLKIKAEIIQTRQSLPSAPKSMRAPLDMASLPHEPPFLVRFRNAPFEVDERDIREFFVECQEIVDVKMIRENNRFKGFGMIEVGSRQDLAAALRCNAKKFKSRDMQVDLADDKQRQDHQNRRNQRGGGGGYYNNNQQQGSSFGDREGGGGGANWRSSMTSLDHRGGGRGSAQPPPQPYASQTLPRRPQSIYGVVHGDGYGPPPEDHYRQPAFSPPPMPGQSRPVPYNNYPPGPYSPEGPVSPGPGPYPPYPHGGPSSPPPMNDFSASYHDGYTSDFTGYRQQPRRGGGGQQYYGGGGNDRGGGGGMYQESRGARGGQYYEDQSYYVARGGRYGPGGGGGGRFGNQYNDQYPDRRDQRFRPAPPIREEGRGPPPPPPPPAERPKLNLLPRTKPIEEHKNEQVPVSTNASIFGSAKPIDTTKKQLEFEERKLKEKEESRQKLAEQAQQEQASRVSSRRTTERTISQSSSTGNVVGHTRPPHGAFGGPRSPSISSVTQDLSEVKLAPRGLAPRVSVGSEGSGAGVGDLHPQQPITIMKRPPDQTPVTVSTALEAEQSKPRPQPQSQVQHSQSAHEIAQERESATTTPMDDYRSVDENHSRTQTPTQQCRPDGAPSLIERDSQGAYRGNQNGQSTYHQQNRFYEAGRNRGRGRGGARGRGRGGGGAYMSGGRRNEQQYSSRDSLQRERVFFASGGSRRGSAAESLQEEQAHDKTSSGDNSFEEVTQPAVGTDGDELDAQADSGSRNRNSANRGRGGRGGGGGGGGGQSHEARRSAPPSGQDGQNAAAQQQTQAQQGNTAVQQQQAHQRPTKPKPQPLLAEMRSEPQNYVQTNKYALLSIEDD